MRWPTIHHNPPAHPFCGPITTPGTRPNDPSSLDCMDDYMDDCMDSDYMSSTPYTLPPPAAVSPHAVSRDPSPTMLHGSNRNGSFVATDSIVGT
ncbi:hypothetical protein TrRE_jg1025, partial [Triparma retinervis]